MTESFPRLQARTRRFTLGVPRGARVTPDGDRVLFLRSRSGTDPVTCLWSLGIASGSERLLADPRDIETDSAGEDLPAQERARRERLREQAGGIVAFTTDDRAAVAAFALSGAVYTADLVGDAGVRCLDTTGSAFDPRIDPTGTRVAYVTGGALWVHDLATDTGSALAEPDADDVTWGLAEFVAAEEMDRLRGYWWSPDGTAILAARVDESPVARWHIADPANPDREPTPVRYPAAGAANVHIGLTVLGLDGTRTPVDVGWGPQREYLTGVLWDRHELLVRTHSRDQRTALLLSVDPATGATTVRHTQTDGAWVDVVGGVPAHLGDGALVTTIDDAADIPGITVGGTRRIAIDGVPVTPVGVQVRDVRSVAGDTVLFTATREPEPHTIALWSWSRGGEAVPLTPGTGVFDGHRAGGVLVVAGRTLDGPPTLTVHRADAPSVEIASHGADPGLTPHVQVLRAGPRELVSALLLPRDHRSGTPLPVLMDPYGGPHGQRVLASRNAHLTSQWFADQGFAVLVVDNRGMPGRGPAFERAVLRDLATPVLDDQVDALHAVAAEHPDLDLGRVGIRGWSFGGFLAALAVLRRPDVFHAAVAGAPVTDWAIYDTFYTERYLGTPQDDPAAYEVSSLLDDAPALTRPLLLAHGMVDDNVVAAHTLRLSTALLAAGRTHSVLPLSGVTHMTPQEVVAENLLRFQVDFLREALGRRVSVTA